MLSKIKSNCKIIKFSGNRNVQVWNSSYWRRFTDAICLHRKHVFHSFEFSCSLWIKKLSLTANSEWIQFNSGVLQPIKNQMHFTSRRCAHTENQFEKWITFINFSRVHFGYFFAFHAYIFYENFLLMTNQKIIFFNSCQFSIDFYSFIYRFQFAHCQRRFSCENEK